jgi:flagellar basal-body rod modification protein FlgD
MASTTAVASTPSVTSASSLNLNDLLQVLLTELTNQDPLKPVDNTDFMAQIAQFASLDSTQQMSQNIQQLVALQAITQTAGLIGRTVSALNASGTVITGTVTALTLSNGTPEMDITANDGTGTVTPSVPIGNLQTIRTPGDSQ